MTKIEQKQIRRSYYFGSIAIIALTAVILSVPVYINIRSEYESKIEQLERSIIDQKKALLKTVIVEKISDFEQRRTELRKLYPRLSGIEFDRLFRQDVREIVHNTVLPDEGYIWINEIVDFGGGDDYAFRFVHPNLVDTEGDFLSTDITDIAGNKPYLVELEGVKADGEVYFDYYFNKMHSHEISHKLTYAKLYRPYNWIVATGVYLDDVDMLVREETLKMKRSTDQTLFNISATIAVSLLLLVFLVVIFEMKIQSLIEGYVSSLQKSNDDLIGEKKKLEDAYKQIESMAYTDFLTGLFNRRAMLNFIDFEVARMKRETRSFALLLCDIDHFKKINDGYGHDAGDFVLKEIASLMEATFREGDRICRWGGEEFLCMVIDIDPLQASDIAEKLRLRVERHQFNYKEHVFNITITIGLAIYDSGNSIDSLFQMADERLYRGKREGRNRVCF